MDDLLDPEVLAEHTRRRTRATGAAAVTFFVVATVLFWSMAYLTALELELPALGALGAGVLAAGLVFWRLSPKRLSVKLDAPAEPDDAALEALSEAFVPPRDHDAAPVSTGTVSEQEVLQAAEEARAAQRAAAVRLGLALAAAFGALFGVFWLLGIRLGLDMEAVPYAALAAGLAGFLVHRGLAPKERVEPSDIRQLADTLAVAEQIDVVRNPDAIAAIASRLGITLPRRHEIRSGGGYLAAARPAPVGGLARLGGLVPFLARTDVVIDELGRPELLARGAWHLTLPLVGERLEVTDPSGQSVGRVERPFGLLRYRLVGDETLALDRDGLALRFRARGADGEEAAALEVFRPSFFARWFLGPFAGERGVHVRFGRGLGVRQRRLLLVAAVHLDRSI
ncbi:MAG: hypothetical protein KC619_24695 [Myxococcales bacterium]|nr:hypothetical protein [Myxococcales bacterium]